jgi:putative addiction module component (TIGR02574 family)
MPSTLDEVLAAALALSEVDRLKIVNRLLETLPENAPGLSDDDPAFADELQRRSNDWDGAVPWEQLHKELRNPQ